MTAPLATPPQASAVDLLNELRIPAEHELGPGLHLVGSTCLPEAVTGSSISRREMLDPVTDLCGLCYHQRSGHDEDILIIARTITSLGQLPGLLRTALDKAATSSGPALLQRTQRLRSAAVDITWQLGKFPTSLLGNSPEQLNALRDTLTAEVELMVAQLRAGIATLRALSRTGVAAGKTLQQVRVALVGKALASMSGYDWQEQPTLVAMPVHALSRLDAAICDLFAIHVAASHTICLVPQFVAQHLTIRVGARLKSARFQTVEVGAISNDIIELAAQMYDPAADGPLASLLTALRVAAEVTAT